LLLCIDLDVPQAPQVDVLGNDGIYNTADVLIVELVSGMLRFDGHCRSPVLGRDDHANCSLVGTLNVRKE